MATLRLLSGANELYFSYHFPRPHFGCLSILELFIRKFSLQDSSVDCQVTNNTIWMKISRIKHTDFFDYQVVVYKRVLFYIFRKLLTMSECFVKLTTYSTLSYAIHLLFESSIRGRLGGVTLVMRNFGILIAYVLGATIDYFQIPIVCVTVPIIFMILFVMLPSTPQYFLRKKEWKVSIDLIDIAK